MATKKITTQRKSVVKTKRTATARKATPKPVMTKRQAVSLLKKGIGQITFRKEDGETRVMFGTLDQNNVPGTLSDTERNGGNTRGVVTVWDVEAYGFRSFRLDRLRKITPRKA